VLRRINGPKRDEMAGSGRILHNEDFHNLCALPNIIIKLIEPRKRR
jgi:hypothetical protein